jgi:hypothetical protein
VVEKMGNIDKRVLYVLLVLVLLYPMVKPIGLPISISLATKTSYDAVEKLKSGDTIMMDFGYYVDGAPDVEPILVAVLKQLMAKNIKVIAMGYREHAPMLIDKAFAPYAGTKVYGTDYVNLGFLAGGETAIQAYSRDIKKAFPRDVKGTPTEQIPILKNITGAAECQMFMFFTDSAADYWVRQVSQFKVPIVGGVITVSAPQAEPYLASGQLTGLLAGLRSAAEYELLMKAPGPAAAGMDAQSTGHVLLILFIIMGNISWLMMKNKKGGAA